jgi:hypothetical protein
MAIFFEKRSDISEETIQRLFADRYLSIKDGNDEYFFDPEHWILIGSGQEWDFKYGSFYFKSQTIEAKELAIMECYGKVAVLEC